MLCRRVKEMFDAQSFKISKALYHRLQRYGIYDVWDTFFAEMTDTMNPGWLVQKFKS
jgi:hypothetical protein